MSDKRQVFSPAQRSRLTAVINRIIPAKDKLPGAGDLGIATSIEETAAGTPELTRLFNDGLAQIGVAAGQDSAGGFEALSNNAKLVEFEAVQKWNGIMPNIMMGGGAVPFISIPTN